MSDRTTPNARSGATTGAALLFENVEFHYPRTPVLRGINLSVDAGQVCAIMGASGSGKTTLARIVAGFLWPSAGTVCIGGSVVASAGRGVPPHRRNVGLVPQEGALFPHLTVRGNVAFGLGGRGAERKRRVDECLEMVGLSGLSDRRPAELSGGQQQRVAVARAIAPSPRVVLLDEPFSALDAGLRAATRLDVFDALRSQGITALLVTHDATEALGSADIVAVLDDGVIAQSGPPPEVYDRPVTRTVAAATGDIVRLHGAPIPYGCRTALGVVEVTYQADGASDVVVRPEQIRLHTVDPEGTSAPADVVSVSVLGPQLLVRVSLVGNAEELLLTVARHQSVEVGQRIALTVTGEGAVC